MKIWTILNEKPGEANRQDEADNIQDLILSKGNQTWRWATAARRVEELDRLGQVNGSRCGRDGDVHPHTQQRDIRLILLCYWAEQTLNSSYFQLFPFPFNVAYLSLLLQGYQGSQPGSEGT